MACPSDLKSARRALGLSVKEFAWLVGLRGADPGRNIRRWEDGSVPIPGAVMIIARLAIKSPGWLRAIREASATIDAL